MPHFILSPTKAAAEQWIAQTTKKEQQYRIVIEESDVRGVVADKDDIIILLPEYKPILYPATLECFKFIGKPIIVHWHE